MEWSNEQVEAWLNDDQKKVVGDINWKDHSKTGIGGVEFIAKLEVNTGEAMQIKGFCNYVTRKLTFAVIASSCGRLYGLCIGDVRHTDAKSKKLIRGTHKHKYILPWRDRHAYVPGDITAKYDEVEKAWREFCLEAKITHEGTMDIPVVGYQGDMFK